MNNIIAVTIGDINGIGIELLINLWKKKKINNFILITNFKLLKKILIKKKLSLKIKLFNKNNFNKNFFTVYDIPALNSNQNSYLSLIKSYDLIKEGLCNGIINLPISKEKIINSINKKFIGQTEFYQKKDKKSHSNMIFYSNNIIICTLTTHVQLKKVSNKINNSKEIYNKIINLFKTLKYDFNILKPKILFLGLNPHASENGNIGNEDIKLKKILKKISKKNYTIHGPVSADSAFNKKNMINYDCFVTTYHDQALIPFKILSNNIGANYTGSLSIIRTSPTHGTGIDLVGTKKANPLSLLYCFKLTKKIIYNRKKIA